MTCPSSRQHNLDKGVLMHYTQLLIQAGWYNVSFWIISHMILEVCVVKLAICGFQLSLLSRMMPRYFMSFFSQIC